MDIALRVAECVTMMHDGQKIVEGTPDEIRSNQMVHDLYLGTSYATTHDDADPSSRSTDCTRSTAQRTCSRASRSRWATRPSR